MKHKNCGGTFRQYVIREHNYCFIRCEKCLHVLGGQKEQEKINRLMRIKVLPSIRPI